MPDEHVHSDECQPKGAICWGVGRAFVARWKRKGARRWELLGKPTKAKSMALHRVMKVAEREDYGRGDVLLIADYYDPIQVYELVKR